MESVKQQKFARLLQKELGEIFQKESNTMFGGLFISVTIVRVSPDLKSARVYLSFMLAPSNEEALQKVKDQQWELKKILSKRIRNKTRFIPELFYYYDDSMEQSSKIDEIFDNLDIPPETPETDDNE